MGEPASNEPLELSDVNISMNDNKLYDQMSTNSDIIKIDAEKDYTIKINCVRGTYVEYKYNELNKNKINFCLEYVGENDKVYDNINPCELDSNEGFYEAQEDGLLKLIWHNVTERSFLHPLGITKELNIQVDIKGDNEIKPGELDSHVNVGCLNKYIKDVNKDVKELQLKLGAKVEMCEDFPFEVEDIMPIAEVLARTGKHFENFKKFFENSNFPKGFPVFCEIPLRYSFSCEFKFLKAEKKEVDLSTFIIPEDYEKIVIEEAEVESEKNNMNKTNESRDAEKIDAKAKE